MRRLLVLRPEPGATATAERARARGLDAAAVPLFVVEPVQWKAPDPGQFDGLLLTSANAVRHGGKELEKLRGLEVYAVGDATADAARERGFGIASSGDDGVEHLLASIEGELKLLHPCGEDRRQPQRPRQQITAVPVYRSREIEGPDLSEAAGSVALIHSPRAGRRFGELIADRDLIAVAAISAAAAEAVGEGWESVAIADAPNDAALLALAASLCNKPQPK